jgi:hypothetical protein
MPLLAALSTPAIEAASAIASSAAADRSAAVAMRGVITMMPVIKHAASLGLPPS